ncbi:sulfotransferase [Catenulispora rubra]|uniref:sulfotransferase n=1 Tax=Catenulispora rubra TaxID=280293 RepID=UPI001891F6B5|nr:sulfotransferase [Catenulispora rubra]
MNENGEAGIDAPIIIVSHARSGVAYLLDELSHDTSVTWLEGVNVPRLSAELIQTWQHLESSNPPDFSTLAASATKSTINIMLTTHLARVGAKRWGCAVIGTPKAAEVFARLYPQATFICMYRDCVDMIYSILADSPWGLSDSGFEAFAAAYPGNSVAALADYWAATVSQMLQFEHRHRLRSLRLRYEELIGQRSATLKAARFHAGLSEGLALSRNIGGELNLLPPHMTVGCGSVVPVASIPDHMFRRIDELLVELDYSGLVR